MLHIEKLSLHNFKSFRQATLKFDEGFNCIVGPNGSGKSSLCDSLLFVLGETSLRRMRVSSLQQLINNSAKPNPDDGIKRGWVSVTLAGGEEGPVEIIRIVKSNGKVGYRLNGKHVTRQDVISVLHAHRSEVESTNTITQGEITKIFNLNAKERRELIDVAAGIREFDEKKDASLKELEKVEVKIGEAKIMMNERKGFLAELEKEKRDAEKYNEVTTTLKRSNYTILKLREKQLEEEHEKLLGARRDLDNKVEELDRKLKENAMEMDKLGGEKTRLSEELNKRSVEVNSANHKIEELAKQIAVIKEQMKAAEDSTAAMESQGELLEKEKAEIEARMKENSSSMQKMKEELSEKEKELGEGESYVLSEEDNTKMVKRYEEKREELERLTKELAKLETEKGVLESNMRATEGMLAEIEEALTSALGEYAKIEEEIGDSKEAAGFIEEHVNALNAELKKLLESEAELKKVQSALDMEMLKVKERIAIYGSSDRTGSVLAKQMGKGFYGRVRDLITYDNRYAEAVSAAAQSRLNYFVVDDVESAERAIRILKEESLERSSFIPIKDIIVGEQKAVKGLKRVVDLVSFDAKFEKVMEFIFSNTFLIDSVGKAKEIGIGRARFVTLEGELVESSGVVSGGASKSVPSIAVLNSKIAELQREKSTTDSKLDEISREIEAKRKELAEEEVQKMANSSDEKRAEEELSKARVRLEALKAKKEAYYKDLSAWREALSNTIASINELEGDVSKMKEETTSLYSAISGMLAMKGRSAADEKKRAKLSASRDRVEQLKVNIASLTKENEMIQQRIDGISKGLNSYASQIKELKEKKKTLQAESEKLEKAKEELESTIKEHDSKSASLFKSVSELEGKLSKLSFENGKMESELAKAKAEAQVHEMSLTQVQTRLADIKAELMSYQDVIPIEGLSIKELEDKIVLLKADLESLGSVNLKAPEIYEERRKMLEEAEKKLATLESEKNSILSIINEVESKKLNVFNETLEKVSQNFAKLYPYVFEGEAKLQLSDPKDPFNSGLTISISKTKSGSSVDAMSGGEKSLIALMLIFSIQMMKPMALYIFDEIDAALDEENSKKLSKLIKELGRRSQFIVVSHNNALIQAADAAIGVAKQDGESRVVGIEIASTQISTGAKNDDAAAQT